MVLTGLFVILPIVAFVLCLQPFLQMLKENRYFFVLLALLVLALFHRFVFDDVSIIQRDANFIQVPLTQSYRDSILSYGHAFMESICLGGIVTLAHPLAHVFSPIAFLQLIFPAHQALNLSFITMTFFASAFMFLFTLQMVESKSAALVAAVAYSFNEFVLDRVGASTGPGIEYLYSYAFIPLALALLWRAFTQRNYFDASLFGLALVFVINQLRSAGFRHRSDRHVFRRCPGASPIHRALKDSQP